MKKFSGSNGILQTNQSRKVGRSGKHSKTLSTSILSWKLTVIIWSNTSNSFTVSVNKSHIVT